MRLLGLVPLFSAPCSRLCRPWKGFPEDMQASMEDSRPRPRLEPEICSAQQLPRGSSPLLPDLSKVYLSIYSLPRALFKNTKRTCLTWFPFRDGGRQGWARADKRRAMEEFATLLSGCIDLVSVLRFYIFNLSVSPRDQCSEFHLDFCGFLTCWLLEGPLRAVHRRR